MGYTKDFKFYSGFTYYPMVGYVLSQSYSTVVWHDITWEGESRRVLHPEVCISAVMIPMFNSVNCNKFMCKTKSVYVLNQVCLQESSGQDIIRHPDHTTPYFLNDTKLETGKYVELDDADIEVFKQKLQGSATQTLHK